MKTFLQTIALSLLTVSIIFSQNSSYKVFSDIVITGDEVSNLPQKFEEVVTGEPISFDQVDSPNFVWAVHNISNRQSGYDMQSNASTQQVWYDLNHPGYVHAVFVYSGVCNNAWADRTSLYFGSTNSGATWFELGQVPYNNGTTGRSGFPSIHGTSTGSAVISNHNNAVTPTRTTVFIDSSPFSFNFTNFNPGAPAAGEVIWPVLTVTPNDRVVVASSINDGTDFYINTLSGGSFSGWQLHDGDQAETHSLAVSSTGKVGLAYIGQPPNDYDVFYKESTNGGLTWSTPNKIWDAVADPYGDYYGPNRGVNVSFNGENPAVVFECGWNSLTGYYPQRESEIRFWSPIINGGVSKTIANNTNVPFYKNYGVADVMYPIGRPVIGRSQIDNYLFVAFQATTGDYWPGSSAADSTAYFKGMFMYSTNGGSTWSYPERFTPISSPLLDFRYVSIVPVSPLNSNVIKLHLVMQGDPMPASTANGWGIMPPSITAQYYHFSTDITVAGSSSITVTSPNGGENWPVGSNQTIIWSSSNVTNVKIEYTTDGGSSWITIIGSTPSDGTHGWTIPNTPSSNCKVKISDVANPSTYDQSNNPFSIIQPSLTVTSPNGGESWLVGSNQNITWSSSNVSNVKIEYSTNSGVSWITVIGSTPSDGTYSWTIPNTPSGNCRVKISDVTNLSVYDESNGDFSIVQPSVTVSSPNGGEGWQIGTAQNISWTSSNVTNVKIEYTTNNGSSWITVIGSTPSDGTYEWTIPNTPSTQCKVKISDVANPSIYDESNSTFSIIQFLFYALIQADSVWNDLDYDGLELGLVDGSGSYISQGSIINYEWYVNNEFVANGVTPSIELTTGTSIVKLIVYSSTGYNTSDSMYISVYASKLATGGAILSGISQYGNSFYVTSMNNGVYRIDSTGTILQSYITGGSIQSSLCISNQTDLMYVGSTDTRLYCFDPGLNSLWDRGLGGVVNNSASVNYDGSIVYVGANDNGTNLGFLKSLVASNGNPKWTFQADGTILSSPVVMELVDSNYVVIRTIIYFGTSKGTVYAINDFGASYELFWSETVNPDSAFVSSPAISKDGMLYIGSKNGYLYRFNWDGNYQTSWRKYTGGAIISSPIIDENEIVYIASGSGYIYGFDKNFTFNSDPVKTFYQNVGINGTAGIGPDGTLLVGSNNGKFLALDKNIPGINMPLKWYFQATGPILAPTLVTNNGIVYIGSTNGDIFIMRDPYIGDKQSSLSDYEWPTFKGDNQRSKVVRLVAGPTSVGDEDKVVMNYNLYQNYPNPFNPSTRIKFQIPSRTLVSLRIFDVLGNEVGVLVNREMETGSYEVEFDASEIPSGIYFYRLQTESFVETKKMILLK